MSSAKERASFRGNGRRSCPRASAAVDRLPSQGARSPRLENRRESRLEAQRGYRAGGSGRRPASRRRGGPNRSRCRDRGELEANGRWALGRHGGHRHREGRSHLRPRGRQGMVEKIFRRRDGRRRRRPPLGRATPELLDPPVRVRQYPEVGADDLERLRGRVLIGAGPERQGGVGGRQGRHRPEKGRLAGTEIGRDAHRESPAAVQRKDDFCFVEASVPRIPAKRGPADLHDRTRGERFSRSRSREGWRRQGRRSRRERRQRRRVRCQTPASSPLQRQSGRTIYRGSRVLGWGVVHGLG